MQMARCRRKGRSTEKRKFQYMESKMAWPHGRATGLRGPGRGHRPEEQQHWKKIGWASLKKTPKKTKTKKKNTAAHSSPLKAHVFSLKMCLTIFKFWSLV